MFSVNHFIWLGIAVIFIIGMNKITEKKNLSFDFNLNFLCVVSVCSELLKISRNIVPVESLVEGVPTIGYYLNVESLPFHLCTMQIFFLLYLRFFCHSEKTRNNILGLMFPTMLLGGICAMLIPTEGCEFNVAQVYQYFIFHMCLVYFAIYIYRTRQTRFEWMMIIRNFAYIFGLVIIDLWINSMLQHDGANFMYLSRPPLPGLPLLNLDAGWPMYIFRIMILVVISFVGVQTPFILKANKQGNS